jgi:hypothetical protein
MLFEFRHLIGSVPQNAFHISPVAMLGPYTTLITNCRENRKLLKNYPKEIRPLASIRWLLLLATTAPHVYQRIHVCTPDVEAAAKFSL